MRCIYSLIGSIRAAGMLACLTAALLLLQWVTPAHAQQRPVQLPQDARYGELKAFNYPRAQIGKEILHLAPGAKIFNTQNLIIMPAAMPASAQVLYRLDSQGQIMQIWLLTAAEAAEAKKRATKPKP